MILELAFMVRPRLKQKPGSLLVQIAPDYLHQDKTSICSAFKSKKNSDEIHNLDANRTISSVFLYSRDML